MVRRVRAFTLLELLTVIGILGLLVSILIPTLSAARASAKANVCISNLKNIGTSFALYLSESADTFPPHRLERVPPDSPKWFVNDLGRREPTWHWFLPMEQPVMDVSRFKWAIDDVGFFDDRTPDRRGSGPGTQMNNQVFRCPTLDDPLYELNSRDGAYGYNYQYLGNSRNDRTPARWDNFPVQLHRIKSPSGTVVAGDSRGAGSPHGPHSYTLDPPRLAVEADAQRFGPNPAAYTGDYLGGDVIDGRDPAIFGYSPAEARHKRAANAVFADAHAEAMTLVEFGYELSDGTNPPDVPKNTPIPIGDPKTGSYKANNRKWNGQGSDALAEEHRAAPP